LNSVTRYSFAIAALACSALLPAAKLQAQSPAWTQIQASGQNYDLFRFVSTTVYDPVSNELIVFGGQSQEAGDPNLNDTWILSNANGLGGPSAWTNLIANGAPGNPPPLHGQSAVCDSVNNILIVLGGCEGGCEPVSNSVWLLSYANGQGGTPTWSQLSPTGGSPAPRQGHQAVYDPTTNAMIIWGGQNGGGSCGGYNDAWVLSNANGLGGASSWTQLSPSGGRPPDYYASAVYDPTHNVMTAFGGARQAGSCTSARANAVWALSNANGQGGAPVWTKLIAEGAPGSPSPRLFAAAAYNPGSNAMTVFGGQAGDGSFLGDSWVLSNANGIGGTPSWTRLSPTGTYKPVPSARWNGAGMDATNNRFIMWGGVSADGPLWGAWVLAPAN
jgi:hypothetical protein